MASCTIPECYSGIANSSHLHGESPENKRVTPTACKRIKGQGDDSGPCVSPENSASFMLGSEETGSLGPSHHRNRRSVLEKSLVERKESTLFPDVGTSATTKQASLSVSGILFDVIL